MIATSLRSLIAQIGSCPFCMQKSFFAALAAWAVTVLAAIVAPAGALPIAAGLAASALTLLWVAHLTAFSSFLKGEGVISQSRRSLLPLALKLIAIAAAASVMPRTALAGFCSVSCANGGGSLNCGQRFCHCICNSSGRASCVCG